MKYHILSIGVSKHKDPAFRALDFAAKDASDFYRLFTINAGELGYQKLLLDNEATLSNIRTALGDELTKNISPEDAFFFMFSGHGVEAEDESGTAYSHFLAPFDATEDFTNSCISIDYLKSVFEKLPGKASFIFVDSCFSGSINSKALPNPKKKKIGTTKSFTQMSLGSGSVAYTACKDDETALEDPELENGLFTHLLLKELQKKREVEQYPVENLFAPVTSAVSKRAKERYNHIQTPTVNSHFEGVVYLPVFKNELKITPQILTIPRYPELTTTTFPAPKIELEDKQREKIINDLSNMVVESSQNSNLMYQISFERFCIKLVKSVQAEWEKIFQKYGADLAKIPEAVSSLEAESYQLIMLGTVIATFGSIKQMEIYASNIAEILNWGKEKAGYVVYTTIPEIIMAEIIYSIGTICLARRNLDSLKILLFTKVEDPSREGPPLPLYAYNEIYYCDALGGNASKVGDHIREMLKSYEWLSELAPRIEGKTDDYQLQMNFLLVMLLMKNDVMLYADFGRYYGNRLKPLINKIKYDKDFRIKLSRLFDLKEEEIRPLLIKQMEKVERSGVGNGFFWMSVDTEDFMTPEEMEKN